MGRGIILEQAVYQNGDMIAYHCCPSAIVNDIQEDESVYFIEKASIEEMENYTLTNAKGAKKMLCKKIVSQLSRRGTCE